MSSFFAGLEKFGFKKSDIEKTTVLKERDLPVDKTPKPVKREFNINDYIFQKPYECPICYKSFTSPTIKAGKIKLTNCDYDLRPIYEHIEPLYYGIIMCNHCGYAAATQKFGLLSDTFAARVQEFLSSGFKPMPTVETVDIHSAIDRYKLALLCATKRNAKDGERAFLCLKLTWLYRILNDHENELSCMALALKGFKSAYTNESMPVCGLNANTILFIIAAFSKTLGNNNEATKYLSSLILDKSTSKNIKERALDMRDEIFKLRDSEK